ncbi:translation initiation factor IF-1 [Patescibacteria group bacterium]|nr:translation initiation factor IF-1 [Patescibacteria group bacterium]
MTKNDDTIEVTGIIEECLPNTEFIVRIEDENYPEELKIRAYLAGRMRMNYIKILPGDKVTVALNPYNTSIGRIVYRHK